MNDSAVSASPALSPAAPPARKRLDFFERFLSFWVLVCMVAGRTGGLREVATAFPAQRNGLKTNST
jgi:ACR3 family arsenite efflux pump ArsB